MWNYIKEVIINDPNVIKKDGDVVIIKRGGNYDVNNIQGKIMKTVGHEGVLSTAKITYVAPTADVQRVSIFLGTPGTEFVEFAYPNWYKFGKPFIVESAATSAAELAKAIKLALNEDNNLFSVSEDAGVITLTASEPWMNFDEVSYDDVKVEDNKETVTKVNDPVLTAGKNAFATAQWIVENLRFPSHPNLRYAPMYADESPVAGTVYTEYSFEYKVERSQPGGMSAVGQVVDSAVRIVFYVAPGAAQTEFESKFGASLIDTTTSNV